MTTPPVGSKVMVVFYATRKHNQWTEDRLEVITGTLVDRRKITLEGATYSDGRVAGYRGRTVFTRGDVLSIQEVK